MNIGNAIKELRIKRKMSQQELAERLKISQGFLSLIEKNSREPSFGLISNIAKELKIPEQLVFLLACEKSTASRRYLKPLKNIASALDDILVAVTQPA